MNLRSDFRTRSILFTLCFISILRIPHWSRFSFLQNRIIIWEIEYFLKLQYCKWRWACLCDEKPVSIIHLLITWIIRVASENPLFELLPFTGISSHLWFFGRSLFSVAVLADNKLSCKLSSSLCYPAKACFSYEAYMS